MTRADQALANFRSALAVEMRMSGAGCDSIAAELGFAHRSGAWKAVQRALDARMVTAANRYRINRVGELEAVHRASWPAAIAGDLEAVGRCLAASKEKAFLLDL